MGDFRCQIGDLLARRQRNGQPFTRVWLGHVAEKHKWCNRVTVSRYLLRKTDLRSETLAKILDYLNETTFDSDSTPASHGSRGDTPPTGGGVVVPVPSPAKHGATSTGHRMRE